MKESKIVFSTKESLKSHVLSVHKKERPFKCNECQYSSSDNGKLKRHILSVHKGERLFKCNECDKGFSQKATLISIRNTVTLSAFELFLLFMYTCFMLCKNPYSFYVIF